MDNDKSYRKSYRIKGIEKKIKEDKKDVATDLALLGASALAVGIGALGIFVLGPDLINSFKSGNALTFGSFMLVKFKEACIGTSLAAVIAGALGIDIKVKDTLLSIDILIKDKELLKEEINLEKEKSLVKRK